MRSKLKAFFELIKFEHTVFALPFAYLGMLLAAGGWPGWSVFLWITVAMAAARTAGMTLNRVIDVKSDAQNPRTQNRPSVTGEIPAQVCWAAAAAALLIFFVSSWMLNPLCFKLSPIAVILLSTYHYVKRFSFLSHFALGLVLAVAPVGGWFAVTGVFAWQPVFLSFAVLFWVAGFDILYSLQDQEFDRMHGLHSVPVKFGQRMALRISGSCHVITILFLLLFGFSTRLGVVYWAGVIVVAALLKVEHALVDDGDLSRINSAFFTVNGWVGILLFVFTFMEIFR
jgi:4-hydroxybenzoate polyprenyltransferase